MLVNHNIKNFNGGVSQQPDEDRFDNQVESMINFMPTPAQGLRRRNPVELVKTLVISNASKPATHIYDRGDNKEYIFMMSNSIFNTIDTAGAIKARIERTYSYTDILGAAATGTVRQIWDNLTPTLDWKNDIKFLTVGDTTWVLNTKITPKMDTAVTPAVISGTQRAFYWVKKSFDDGAGGGYTYEIIVDSIVYSATGTSTITVATDLASQLTAAGFGVIRHGSVIGFHIFSTTTFESGDSWGNQASKGWNGSVAKISDLPADMNGFAKDDVGTIAITGTDRDSFNNYYLVWEEDHWAEAVKEGITYKLDRTTMPAKIVMNSSETFTLGFQEDAGIFGFDREWDNRIKGDDDSNPIPSFIDRQIKNMFFFKNRLGFTADENVILSETGGYYNFFATTAMEVLDSDPIDAGVDSNTVTNIRNVNVTAGAVTIWADNAQFVLSGGDILSPATTRVSQTSSYICDNMIPPITIDNEIMFFNRATNYLEAMTYAPASLQSDKSSAESSSSHIPEYLPASIDTVVVSTASNMVFLRDSTDGGNIYVYKYLVQGGQKVLTAWFKWTVTTDTINGMFVMRDTLYLFLGDYKLAKIELEPKDITANFRDFGVTTYESSVVMSKYNIELSNGVRAFRQPFYVSNLKVSREGSVDLDIINSERNSTKTVDTRFVDRRLLVGGNSDKINIGLSTSYNTGCELNTVSIEGRFNTKSKNI